MSLLTVAASAAFLCTPVAVWDGDGPIWCAEGPKIRLGSIAARELDGSCRAGHATGEYSINDLGKLFEVSRPTVYRTIRRGEAAS